MSKMPILMLVHFDNVVQEHNWKKNIRDLIQLLQYNTPDKIKLYQ